ncbi:alkaline phosphatase family protein [Haladaptatus sp. DJG-WS-42]|uniref:alkaline phosphatase family protein n=1 Tax=Haladaptatus sp. DJG-WS-42 TaxID=3120516 RepID=UPI0030CF7461
MIHELSKTIEEWFSFEPLDGLENTKERLQEKSGGINYIPTNYPIPESKRALNVLIGDLDTTRALPMPSNVKELQETIFAAVEFIIKKDGSGNVVFFCPSPLVQKIDSCRGTRFFQPESFEIDDPNHVRRQVYKKLTGDHVQHLPTRLPDFLLQAYLNHALDNIPSLSVFETTEIGDTWDMYVSYQSFSDERDEFREFYLDVLDVRSVERFENLPEKAQRQVYEYGICRRYGTEYGDETGQFVTRWRALDGEVKTLFRDLARERLLKGRLFNNELLELAGHGGREFIEQVQRGYQSLFDSEKRINQRSPEDAADALIQYFGLLYQDASKEEIRSLLLSVRDKLVMEADRIGDRPPTGREEAFNQVDSILECVSEVQLISSSPIIEEEFHSKDWVSPLEELYEVARASGQGSRLESTSIPAIAEARRRVEYRRAAEAEADRIQQMDASLDTAPEFFSQWAKFITTNIDGESGTDAYHQAMVDKYDELSDALVEEYPSLVDNPDRNHISELIDDESEDLQIVVIIDSLGFMDFALMEQWDIYSPSVDVEPLYSNIPSYTPSAMATILTGLPAERTGIYNWTVKNEDQALNLKNRVSLDKLDFIGEESNLSYKLIQNNKFNDSGITRFARKVANIKLTEDFQREGNLEEINEEIENKLESHLKERKELLTGNADAPSEHLEKRIEALNDTFVVYIEDFDSLLHKNLAEFEFENYYRSLGSFLDELVSTVGELISEYSHDESPKLVIGGDHGKITRQERDLVLDVRNQERFTQSSLSDRVDVLHAHKLNLGEARFDDGEDSILLGIGDFSDVTLVKRARDFGPDSCESASDSEVLRAIQSEPFVVSGSKYLFAWQPAPAPIDVFQFGYDTYLPAGNSIFDNPTIGLLSRYVSKNVPKAHAYHGGTSISEMTSAKLTFHDKDI